MNKEELEELKRRLDKMGEPSDKPKSIWADPFEAIYFDYSLKMEPAVDAALLSLEKVIGKTDPKHEDTLNNILCNLYEAWLLQRATGRRHFVDIQLNSNKWTGKANRYPHLSYRYFRSQYGRLRDANLLKIKKGATGAFNTKIMPIGALALFFERHHQTKTLKWSTFERAYPVEIKDKVNGNTIHLSPDVLSRRKRHQFDRICEEVDWINSNNSHTTEHEISIPVEILTNFIAIEYGIPDILSRIVPSSSIEGPSLDVVLSVPSTKNTTRDKLRKLRLLLRILTSQRSQSDTCFLSHLWLYRRVFNLGRLDKGGRYFAVLSSMPSSLRPHMLIDGEPVVELDYSCLHPSMLLAEDGKKLATDLYDPRHYWRLWREHIKVMFQYMLNSSSKRQAIQGIQHAHRKGEIELPELPPHQQDEDPNTVEYERPTAIVAHLEENNFKPIQHHLYSEKWADLQYQDSLLATEAMTHFARKKEVCLSIHDSFLVRQSLKDELHKVMTEAYQKRFKFAPIIKDKSL